MNTLLNVRKYSVIILQGSKNCGSTRLRKKLENCRYVDNKNTVYIKPHMLLRPHLLDLLTKTNYLMSPSVCINSNIPEIHKILQVSTFGNQKYRTFLWYLFWLM